MEATSPDRPKTHTEGRRQKNTWKGATNLERWRWHREFRQPRFSCSHHCFAPPGTQLGRLWPLASAPKHLCVTKSRDICPTKCLGPELFAKQTWANAMWMKCCPDCDYGGQWVNLSISAPQIHCQALHVPYNTWWALTWELTEAPCICLATSCSFDA